MELKFFVVLLLLGLEESISTQQSDGYEHGFPSMVLKHRVKRTTCECTCASGATGRGASGMQTNRAGRPADGADKGPQPPSKSQGPGPVQTPSGVTCPKEPKDEKFRVSKSGCHNGYCWTVCHGVLGINAGDREWCYTTMGSSQDYGYVGCSSDAECCTYWSCAGSCTV